MFATPISPDEGSGAQPVNAEVHSAVSRAGFAYFTVCLFVSLFFLCVGILSGAAENTSSVPASVDSYTRTKKVYLEARARYQAATNNSEAAWQFARACFDRAVAATNNAERAKMAA